MMRQLAALAVAAALAGCAAHPAPLDPLIVTKTVEVPVRAQCVPPGFADQPAYKDADATLRGLPTPEARYQAVLAGREQRRTWADQAQAVISGCR